MLQVKFLVKEELNNPYVLGGFELKNKRVICGCCGHIYNPEEVYVLRRYKDWVDLTDELLGEDKMVTKAHWVDAEDGKTYSAIILDDGKFLDEDGKSEPWCIDQDFIEGCDEFWETEEAI